MNWTGMFKGLGWSRTPGPRGTRAAGSRATFYEPAQFGFVAALEANWQAIRDEAARLPPDSYQPWPERNLYGEGWSVFGFRFFGKRFEENARACPSTAALVEAIPGLTTAGFSALKPGTHIQPHKGRKKEALRCHLGLIIPEGCGLRVGPDTREWEEGKCLVFDDLLEHEAWNRGVTERIVLLVDIVTPH